MEKEIVMKRLLSAVMIATLSIGLAGCGSSVPATGTAQETTVAVTETTAAATTTSVETTVVETMTAETMATSASKDGVAAETTAESTVESISETTETVVDSAEAQQKLLEAFASAMKTVDSVAPFESEDMDGNIVTDEIFKDADVTLVHVWATYCPPCLAEMENLGKMAESLPENAQVLGIVADVTDGDKSKKEEAVGILKENSVSFTNVVMSQSFDDLSRSIIGVPTTFVVDSEGKIVGAPVIGSAVEEYERRAKEYLQSIGK